MPNWKKLTCIDDPDFRNISFTVDKLRHLFVKLKRDVVSDCPVIDSMWGFDVKSKPKGIKKSLTPKRKNDLVKTPP